MPEPNFPRGRQAEAPSPPEGLPAIVIDKEGNWFYNGLPIINRQIEDDQFINANITFKEIQSIKKVLKHKLANIYHLRIEYPE